MSAKIFVIGLAASLVYPFFPSVFAFIVSAIGIGLIAGVLAYPHIKGE